MLQYVKDVYEVLCQAVSIHYEMKNACTTFHSVELHACF